MAARQPSQNELYRRKIDQIFRQNGQIEAVAARRMLTSLNDVRSGLVAQIASIGTDGSFQAAHLRALIAAIEAASTEIQVRMGSQVSGTLDQGWARGERDTNDLIRIGGGDPSLLPLHISVDALNIAQASAADMVRYVSQDFVARARQYVSLGILGQRPAFAIMQDVAGLLRTQPTRQNPKLGTTAYQAERIVRTESNAIYSLASALRQQQAAEVMPDPRKSWITARDQRVRDSHVAAGRRYGRGGDPGPILFPEPYMVGGEPMQHPHDPSASAKERINCRCISIMVSEDWAHPEPTAEPEEVAAPPTGYVSATVGPTRELVNRLFPPKDMEYPIKVKSLPHGGVLVDYEGPEALWDDMMKEIMRRLEQEGAKVRDRRYAPKETGLHVVYLKQSGTPPPVVVIPRPGPTIIKPPPPTGTGAAVRAEMVQYWEQEVDRYQFLLNQYRDVSKAYHDVTRRLYNPEHPLSASEKAMLEKSEEMLYAQLASVKAKRDAQDASNRGLFATIREKFIYQEPQSDDKLEINKSPSVKDWPETWSAGVEAFRRIVGKAVKGQIWFAPPNARSRQRAYCSANEVHCGLKAGTSTVVHEMSHAMEHNIPAIREARKSLQAMRERGEKAQFLWKVFPGSGYRRHEIFRQDKWIHNYMGRDYTGKRGPAVDSDYTDRDTSEIISMGVQLLYENPVKLAQQDPEFFDWIYDLLRSVRP